MKRITALFLSLAMLLALAACGGGSNPPAQTGGDAQTPPAQTGGGEQTPPPADDKDLTETQKIIREAEGMTLEELARKDIE